MEAIGIEPDAQLPAGRVGISRMSTGGTRSCGGRPRPVARRLCGLIGIGLVAMLSFGISFANAQIAQAPFSVATVNSTVAFGGTTQLLAIGGSGTGAVTYVVTSGAGTCAISGTTLTGTSASGTCVVTATKAGDGTYLAATDSMFVYVSLAAQPSLFTMASPGTINAGQTATLSTSGGAGTGTVTYAAFTTDAAICSVSGNVVTGLSNGSCRIDVRKAGDANYNPATAITSVVVNKATQAQLFISATPFSLTYGGTATVSASGGSGTGSVTFTSVSPSICSISGTTLTAIGSGTCRVDATKAGDAAYLPTNNSLPLLITIGKAAQNGFPAFRGIPTPGTISVGATSTVNSTGGDGTGAVTYAMTGIAGVCTLSGTTVTAIGAGTCEITATKASDANYLAASNRFAIYVNKANQAGLSLSVTPSALAPGATSTLAATGGTGTGAINYALVTGAGICSLSGATVTALAEGSCEVSAIKAADNNYNTSFADYATITVKKLSQPYFLVMTPGGGNFATGGTLYFGYLGGAGSGAVTFAITSGSVSCTISSVYPSGVYVTATAPGTCTLTATNAGDATYLPASASATLTATGTKRSQATLAATATPTAIVVGNTTTLGTTGGSGSGAVSYAVTSGASFCSVSGATVTGTGSGICTVTATKATDLTYVDATATVDVSVGPGPQAALAVSASPATFASGSTSTLATTGGSGTGAVTYAITSGTCTVSGSTISNAGSGTCAIAATKAADSNYQAATASTSVTVTRLPQAAMTTYGTMATFVYGGTSTLGTSGGSGSGAVTYVLDSGSSFCSLSGNIITGIGVGSCSFTATKAADATYDATTASGTVNVIKAPQAAMSLAAAPAAIVVGGTSTLNATGGSGTSPVTFAVLSGSAFCSITGNTLTGIGAGSCTVRATKPPDATYNGNSATTTVTVGLALQAALTVAASPATVPFNSTSILGTTGGSGTGAVTYAVTAGASSCSIVGATLTGIGAGLCTVTATKAADGTYDVATGTVTITVTPIAQSALTASASPTAVVPGGTSILGTTGGSGTGAVTYAITTGGTFCSIAGNTLTGLGVGSCTVTATKAADANYTAATSSASVIVAKAVQATLAASASPASIAFNSISTLSTTGGSGTGAVSYAVTAGGTFCSIAGNTLTGTGVGSCTIAATKAADANYNAATTSTSVTVNAAVQATLNAAATPATVDYGATATLSTTGGSGTGTVTYAVTAGAAFCSITGNTLTGTGVGSCTIIATKAADANYAASNATASVTVGPATQAALTASASPSSIAFNGTTTLATTGGSGIGTVSFAVTAGGTFCSLAGSTLTGTGVGTCTVTATKAADANYTAATASASVTVGPAAQAALAASASPASISFGGTSMLATTGGSGAGAVSYAVTAGGTFCAIAGTTLNGTGVGSCTVTATKAADANYTAATATTSVIVGKASQSIAFTPPTNQTFGAFPVTLVATATSGLAVAFASATAPVCVVSGATATIIGAGTCSITASQAGDANYAAATDVVQTFSVGKASQSVLTASASPASISFGGTSTLATAGGSGTGVVSYAVTTGSTSCSIAGSTLTGTGVGSCTVTATKAADTNYTSATTTASVTVGPAAQAALTASASPASIAFNGVSTLSASGGSGTGAVTYAVATGGTFCSITGNTLTGTGVGSCTITATKAADANYAVATATVSATVGPAAQAPLTTSASPASIAFNGVSTLSTSGGSGTGAVTYAVTAGGTFCSVTGNILTGTGVGSCTATATKAGDANYSAATATASVTVGKAAQSISFTSTAPAAVVINSPPYAPAAMATSSLPVSLSVDAGSQSVCSMSGGTVSFLATGVCAINANQLGNGNFAAAPQARQTIQVGKIVTSMTLTASHASVLLGQSITFTAKVVATSAAPGQAALAGTVLFLDRGVPLCSGVPLASGTATCTISFTTVGAHSVNAAYSGASAFAASASVVLAPTVINQQPRTADAIAKHLGQRTNQILSNEPNASRQIDRLIEAGSARSADAARGGTVGTDLASGDSARSRLGAGASGADVSRLRLGVREQPRPGPFDSDTATDAGTTARRQALDGIRGGALPLQIFGSTEEATRLNFATSLAEFRRHAAGEDSRRALAAGVDLNGAGVARPAFNPFDLWVEGRYASLRDNRGASALDGYFALGSFGADYVMSRSLLIGGLVQFDSVRNRWNAASTTVDGQGWMAGPYATIRISENMFWQGRAAWGQSTNKVSPDTTYTDTFVTDRWLAASTLSGRWGYGAWTFKPSATVNFMEDAARGYADSYGVAMPGVRSRLGLAKVGPDISYRIERPDGVVIEPHVGMQLMWNFAGDTTAGGIVIGGDNAGTRGLRGQGDVGVRVSTPRGMAIDLSGRYDGIGTSGYSAVSGQAGVRVPLN